MLQDLADSIYLQNEMLSGDKVSKVIEEKFNQLNSVAKVDSLLITDNEDIITTHKASEGLETFVNIDISSNEYLKQTKESLQPVYSDGLTGIDGKYMIVITTVTTAIKSDKVQVTVKDIGIGIHPEIFAKLFSKFVTKSDRGTGLGLFISKSIIEAHGGNIWAESGSQQKGATFIFTLPLLNQDKIEHQNDE
jgi:light-regulated signal transduction histidine kinase (bacteriophytochrome)